MIPSLFLFSIFHFIGLSLWCGFAVYFVIEDEGLLFFFF